MSTDDIMKRIFDKMLANGDMVLYVKVLFRGDGFLAQTVTEQFHEHIWANGRTVEQALLNLEKQLLPRYPENN
jgi:hypothetical protein